MPHVFISHSKADDAFVRALQQALADHQVTAWIDSRELAAGGLLEPGILSAIEAASAFVVVVSPAALQSRWVGKELAHALRQQKERDIRTFPVIPMSLDGTKLGVLEDSFGSEPTYLTASSAPGGIEAAINHLLVALRLRLPTDLAHTPQPKAEPMEELVLHLTNLRFEDIGDKRRAVASARLVYHPAAPGRREVSSAQNWKFAVPESIDSEELRWYLEKYYLWPACVPVIQERARRLERNLITWGQDIHRNALPPAHVANVLQSWGRIDSHTGRRFSVLVDDRVEAASTQAETDAAKLIAKEAANDLLRLPWELLHDGRSYLFQGAKPIRVRRCLPNTKDLDVVVVDPPIRILLVTARPEDDACGYIDHRASALPLVDAVESLPGLVQLHILQPPTLPALRAELDRARAALQPYHVLHFDGHGVYDKRIGLGGLCFEHPDDTDKLERRRHRLIYTHDHPDHGTGLASLLLDHRVPLVFLEACQTAQSDKASESVASELLHLGVASVVAMTHSVLIETARRFVAAFYQSLASGQRVGDAMLEGQRRLKDDNARGQIFGNQELRLEDWFVPVLYQETDDPQLFRAIQSAQTIEDASWRFKSRLGELPPPPGTGFVGRSRELLALQRLLHRSTDQPITTQRAPLYAVIHGQGGEGKTTLAVEFARWSLRSQQVTRVAFVSVEIHSHLRAIVDALGRQLVGKHFTATGDLDLATQQIERALREQLPTLLVLDNMESLLPPPYLAEQTPEALKAEAQEQLTAILALAQRLMRIGDTRLIFTSREILPPPFDASRHLRDLQQLDKADAVKLVERVLNAEGHDTGTLDETREQIEALIETVRCHARTLALLAHSIQANGVKATQDSLASLMFEMEQRYPGSREQSVFASVELSLRRLSPENQAKVKVVGVFHGGVQLKILRGMMGWNDFEIMSFGKELIRVGLATLNKDDHLSLSSGLCPYIRMQLVASALAEMEEKWAIKMLDYANHLESTRFKQATKVANAKNAELANFLALFELALRRRDPRFIIDVSSTLSSLFQNSGFPRMLRQMNQASERALKMLRSDWDHHQFKAAFSVAENMMEMGKNQELLSFVTALVQRCDEMGQCYSEANWDHAILYNLYGQALLRSGSLDQALAALTKSQNTFATFEQSNEGVVRMLAACKLAQGECLRDLGNFDEAVLALSDAASLASQAQDERLEAFAKSLLGTVHIAQGNGGEAVNAFAAERRFLRKIGDLNGLSGSLHHSGIAHRMLGSIDAAESAFRESLAISVQLDDSGAQAAAFNELGSLFIELPSRRTEAVTFFQSAANIYATLGEASLEGRTRYNLANSLFRLGLFAFAKDEALTALECKLTQGRGGSIWNTWNLLSEIYRRLDDEKEASNASRMARDSYLDYRRTGGAILHEDGHIVHAISELLHQSLLPDADDLLDKLEADYYVQFYALIGVLRSILAGSRKLILADAPGLTYSMAAEIQLLLETLSKSESLLKQ